MKALNDKNDTAVDEDLEEKNSVFLKDDLPKKEYEVIEKEEKKTIERKIKGYSSNRVESDRRPEVRPSWVVTTTSEKIFIGRSGTEFLFHSRTSRFWTPEREYSDVLRSVVYGGLCPII